VAFELEVNESVGTGIRRIIDEQLAAALDGLRSPDTANPDETVHAVRKRFKRLRALARLVRDELGDDLFARENAALRDAGASLSEARDAAVLVQTLDGLKPHLDPQAFAAARRRLVARRKLVARRVLHDGSGLGAVARAAEEAADRVAAWPIHRDGWRALRPGLKRIYANARQAYKRTDVGAPAEMFHEWRKQTKHLWHQLEVLEPIWPPVMKKLADECHALADALGHDHDLAVLRHVLEAEALTHAGEPSPVLPPLEAARQTLQHEALSLGARIYAEKPGAFVRRLGKYWKAWKARHASAAKEAEDSAGPAASPTEEAPTPPADEARGAQGGGATQAPAAGAAASATAALSDNGQH
jgi:CHAD domain-containing protein